MMMTKEAIFKQIQKLLVESFELEEGSISLEAHIYNDLDLDSFDAIDLAVKVETETGMKFQEDDLRSIRTITDIVDILYRKLNPQYSKN